MSGRLPVVPVGLEVVQSATGRWAVIHIASRSTVLGYCPTRAIALHFAERLGPVTDWTQSREELAANVEAVWAIHLAVRDVAEATTRERRARQPRRRWRRDARM